MDNYNEVSKFRLKFLHSNSYKKKTVDQFDKRKKKKKSWSIFQSFLLSLCAGLYQRCLPMLDYTIQLTLTIVLNACYEWRYQAFTFQFIVISFEEVANVELKISVCTNLCYISCNTKDRIRC